MVPYGPAVSPIQVTVPSGPADQPVAWAISIGVGLALTALALPLRRRPALAAGVAAAGQTVLLTAPLLGLLPKYVYGDWPTIDKQGSLLFYLEGVHRHLLAHPLDADYAPARLIGVHVGHLWVTQLFDLFLEPFAAMNAQGLLWLVLGWWCAWGFLRAVSGDARVAFVLALPFGLGLHVFRDLNDYTIEKAAVFAVPLYGTCLLKALRDGGPWPALAALVFAGATFLNLYLGAVLAVSGLTLGLVAVVGAALKEGRAALGAKSTWRLLASAGWSALLVAPLIIQQAVLLSGGRAIASPDCFLEKRAALDVVTLWPPAWDRLEAWDALHPLALVLAVAGLLKARDPVVQALLVVAAVTMALSLGPYVLGATNVVYMAAWHALPFFWRIAKPETFFEATWLCLLGVGAIAWSDRRPSDRSVALGYLAFVAVWVLTVRMHPAYPGFSQYKAAKLDPHWIERLDRQPECEGIRAR